MPVVAFNLGVNEFALLECDLDIDTHPHPHKKIIVPECMRVQLKHSKLAHEL